MPQLKFQFMFSIGKSESLREWVPDKRCALQKSELQCISLAEVFVPDKTLHGIAMLHKGEQIIAKDNEIDQEK